MIKHNGVAIASLADGLYVMNRYTSALTAEELNVGTRLLAEAGKNYQVVLEDEYSGKRRLINVRYHRPTIASHPALDVEDPDLADALRAVVEEHIGILDLMPNDVFTAAPTGVYVHRWRLFFYIGSNLRRLEEAVISATEY